MKKLFFITILMSKLSVAYNQNVGVGTPSPAFKLDVNGGSINTDSVYRIGGNTVLSVKGITNTFTGINSGFSNTTGTENTASGYAALYSNTTANRNTANGHSALYLNTTGSSNVANGYQSLYSNTAGNYNVANGVFTLYHNTNGSFNVANGHQALQWNATGNYNTAIGYISLFNNTTGNDNVSVGRLTLSLNTSGSQNTAVGNVALYNTRASLGNTAVGFNAGNSYDNGYYNTFLGSDADANGNGYYNSIAIGSSSTVTAPVQVRIGASFITSIGGYQNWTTLSDGRFKKNLEENVKGLDFIMKLRPVTYNMDISGLSEKLNENRGRKPDKQMAASIAEKEEIIYSGFVAQEVEQAAKETGYDFSGVDKPKNSGDFYGLRYAEFVVPLVKAVQEQQQIIRSQQAEIDELKKIVNELRRQRE